MLKPSMIASVLACAIALAAITEKASAGSCVSCRDKIITVAECSVSIPSEFSRLRSLPNANAQAIGDISNGNQVFVNDQQGPWAFVQSTETFEGKTAQTDGGWILRSALTNCRDDREK